MPNLNGEATIMKLKEMENFNTPVIALTADAVAGAKEKYMSEGFVDYIAKPFSREQIKEKLDMVFKNQSTEANKVVVDRWKDVPAVMVVGNNKDIKVEEVQTDPENVDENSSNESV